MVGEAVFGSGQMQLALCLQSAETMKAAWLFLEPHIGETEGSVRAEGPIFLIRHGVERRMCTRLYLGRTKISVWQ